MDRVTKIVVLAWICAAIVFEIWVQRSGWPNLPLICGIVAAASLTAGLFQPRLVAVVLTASYVMPVLLRYFHGGTAYEPNQIVWITALVGVLLPSVARTSWNIPAPWRASLVAAALVVVFTSPIVVLREIDLNFGLLRDLHGWSFGGGTWPSLIVTWTLYSSLTLVVGVVWFDWLFSARDLNVQRFVILPLAIGAGMLIAVLIYQLFFDLGFLNDTIFGVQGRAAGTMYDANLSGTVAALWLGGLVLLSWHQTRWRVPLAVLAGLASWLAVWSSGSRTAFGAALIVSAAIAMAMIVENGTARLKKLYIPAIVVAIAAIFLVLVAAANPRIIGPARRMWATLPSPSMSSVREFGAEMWNRNQYGMVATRLIREHPLFGVGVGTYATIAVDSMPGLQPDNAQNWLRHQIVEFGVIGSLGWLIWVVTFAIAVLRSTRHDSPSTWIARGMLVAFGAISMFGMPGQTVTVAVTFWTVAFWYVSLKDDVKGGHLPRWAWAAAVAIALVAAAGTAHAAVTTLRPAARARVTTVPYGYGFGTPQPLEGENGYRLTRSHAVTILDVPSRWLSVSVRINPEVANGQTVDVRVWADGVTVLKAQLGQHGPLTAVVPLAEGAKRVMLEAAARPADSPRPFFVRTAEALYFLKWEFLDRPPTDFNGAGYHRPMSS